MEEEKSTTKFIMNKQTVCNASPNSLFVPNNQEGYDHFFACGGTVAKMDMKTTVRYMKFKREKNQDDSSVKSKNKRK